MQVFENNKVPCLHLFGHCTLVLYKAVQFVVVFTNNLVAVICIGYLPVLWACNNPWENQLRAYIARD